MTGLASIIDIVQNVNSTEFPVRQNINFFCEMTNGHGKCDVNVRMVKSDENDKVLFQQTRPIEFTDVKQVVSLALNLHGIVMPSPGEYRFQLYVDNKFLSERRITCRKVDMPQKDAQG